MQRTFDKLLKIYLFEKSESIYTKNLDSSSFIQLDIFVFDDFHNQQHKDFHLDQMLNLWEH